MCQANAHMSDVHTCRFNPYSPGNEFVSVGNKHTKFWNGDTLEGANGLFGKVGTTQQVLCVAFLPSGQTLTGQLDGSIYVWEGGAIVSKIEKAHAHGVIGMIYCPLGIVTVGCDSQIKVRIRLSSSHAVPSSSHLASGLEPKVSRLHRRYRPEALRGGRPQAARPLPGLHTGGGNRGRRAAVVEHWQHGSRCARVFLFWCYFSVECDRASGPDAGVLLVGTTCGSIIAVGIFSSSEVSVALRTSAAAIIVRGHMGDVNSVACDGDKQVERASVGVALPRLISLEVVYTGSYDGLVRCWDLETKQCAFALSALRSVSLSTLLALTPVVQAYSARTSWSPSFASISIAPTADWLSGTEAAVSAAGRHAPMRAEKLKIS